MIEALNILNGIDFATMRYNSADYINTLVEALKLAYADRDTYYGDPKFAKVPEETLLSMKYADERRALIGKTASQEFLRGRDWRLSARASIEVRRSFGRRSTIS